jgi:hypothetical protein
MKREPEGETKKARTIDDVTLKNLFRKHFRNVRKEENFHVKRMIKAKS